MLKEHKEKVALFRFGVIHPLIGLRESEKVQKEPLVREIVSKEWDIPFSVRSSICRATVFCWLKRYKDSGEKIESLLPRDRNDVGRTRKLDEETEMSLVNLKSAHPTASLPTLLRIAKSNGFIPADFKVSKQTVYRIFRKHGLHIKHQQQEDRRKFQSQSPNDMWQSDAMHGPVVNVDGKLRKTYLFAIIDDHSRLITHAEFYLNENIDAYQDCLQSALHKRGLPRKLYLDNGAAFRSHQLRYVTASLGIALIHARPYKPQGKGKIERWFKTVRSSWLPTVPENLSLQEFNMLLFDWVDNTYNQAVHSTIKQPPFECYVNHLHLVRKAPSSLDEYFRKHAKRKVNLDRTVSFFGKYYEAPLGLMGKTVMLRYHDRDMKRIEVFYEDKSYGFLVELNQHINAKVKRSNTEANEKEVPPLAKPSREYQGGKLFMEATNNAKL